MRAVLMIMLMVGLVFGADMGSKNNTGKPKSIEEKFFDYVTSKGKSYKELKEYQADIISRQFSHLDFVQILPNETIAVSVPLRMVGRAQGVKQGGELKVFARKVRLVCLPKDTPAVVEFDTTPLAIGYVVHFSEISLPEGCKLAPNTEKLPLVSVIGKREEEAAAAPAAGAAPAPAKAAKK